VSISCSSPPRRRAAGFTLTELMLALVLLAMLIVLFMYAAPGMTN